MKTILNLILLISCFVLFDARSGEVLIGGVAYHTIHYSKKIPKTVVAETVGYRGDNFAVFVGNDCIGSRIAGGFAVKKLTDIRALGVQVNAVGGGYFHSRRNWDNSPVHQFKIGVIVPMAGVELRKEFGRVNVNALVGPTSYLSIGFSF